MSLPCAVTFVSPDPTHATITWEYDVRRFVDEETFQFGQVALRALVKKDLYNENIFNWTCNVARCPPGAIVHYRVEAILPKEEGHQTPMSRSVVEGTLSNTQRHCSLLFSTNNRWKSTLVATTTVELHEDVITRDLRPAQLGIQ